MTRYEVYMLPRAQRDFKKLPQEVQDRIRPAILDLAEDPRPHGCEKLEGAGSTYRIRVGDYRVIYDIDDDELIVDVIRARHRKDVYR